MLLAEQDAANSSDELRKLVAAEVEAEYLRRDNKNRWGILLLFVAVGLLLAIGILSTQIWYVDAYYKAGDPGASVAGNPDVGIGLAFAVLTALTIVGSRTALSRGPKPA